MLFVRFIFILLSACFSQGRLDGIVAIVGENMVLHSDVLQQTQLIALEKKN